jgi:hypothetical protein
MCVCVICEHMKQNCRAFTQQHTSYFTRTSAHREFRRPCKHWHEQLWPRSGGRENNYNENEPEHEQLLVVDFHLHAAIFGQQNLQRASVSVKNENSKRVMSTHGLRSFG